MQLAAFNNNNFHARPGERDDQRGPAALRGRPARAALRPRRSMTVGILGMAFKAESDDIRSSLSYKLKRILRFKAAAACSRTDPYVTVDPDLVAARRGARASPTCSSIGAPHARVPRPRRPIGARRRHLEPARATGCRCDRADRPASRSSSRSTTRATSIVALPRPDRSTGVELPCEVLVVYDDDRRHHRPVAREVRRAPTPASCPIAQHLRARARRAPSATASTTRARRSPWSRWPTAATTPSRSTTLCKLVERGVVVAAASRYMSGGQQIGGPFAQESRCRGWPGCRCTGSPGSARATRRTRSRRTRPSFVREVGIESDTGFEIGIELVAKARRLRRPVGRDPHDLARAGAGHVELQGAAVDPALPAVVPLRVRPAAVARAAATERRRDSAMTGDQKVLVTGSSGFIGGYVVEELLGRGYEVVGIDNHSKYGRVAKSYDDHPRLPPGRGRRSRRRADDRAADATATTSSPARRSSAASRTSTPSPTTCSRPTSGSWPRRATPRSRRTARAGSRRSPT